MAWADNLQEASFRGFIFDCIATDDTLTRANATHSYPYVDGAEIEDMGADANTITINAIFYGDDYDARLQQFIQLLNQPGKGELIHPVFGKIEVNFATSSVHHDADGVDQATLTLNFIQSGVSPIFFGQTLSSQKPAAISQKTAATRQAATDLVVAEVAKVKALGDFNRITQMAGSMTDALRQLKADVSGYIQSGLDPILFASAWAADLTGVVNSIVDLRGFNLQTLSSDWKALFNVFDRAILLPSYTRQPKQDSDLISLQTKLEQVSGKADAVRIVLESEVQEPTLFANEIEQMTNIARADIQALIDGYRGAFGIEKSRFITEALKDTALALQEAAIAVIEIRPPLTQKTMNAQGNYRLIAHKLYGDHTRAPELFRLNPLVIVPNFIEQGDVIYAYAQ